MLTPQLDAAENEYRGGVWVRDSTAGIGTVTYVNAADHTFGGLGHGICDVETGELLPMLRGVVVDVEMVKTGVYIWWQDFQPHPPALIHQAHHLLGVVHIGGHYRRHKLRRIVCFQP